MGQAFLKLSQEGLQRDKFLTQQSKKKKKKKVRRENRREKERERGAKSRKMNGMKKGGKWGRGGERKYKRCGWSGRGDKRRAAKNEQQ